MNERGKKPVDRQTLYEEVWSDPVTIVAERYGLSDVGLAKICRKLRIPLPRRGYWAKVKAGRTMPRMPLPKVADTRLPYVTLAKIDPAEREARTAARQKVIEAREAVRSIVVPSELSDPHPLIRAAVKRLKQRDGWTDEKGLRSAPAEVLHLEVTRAALDRALLIMDTLIKALAKRTITARVDAQAKRTVLDVEGTAVALILSEHVKRTPHAETPAEKRARERYWNRSHWDSSVSYPDIPRFDFHPTGVLTVTAGLWPSRSWKDTPRTPLEKRLGEVVAGIGMLAADIRAKEAEEARRREVRRRAEERYAFLKQRLENERARFEQLEADATDWERASRLRAYVDAVEQKARSTGNVVTPELQDWIAWARAKADWLDPLIPVSDPILDAPEPRQPGYYW